MKAGLRTSSDDYDLHLQMMRLARRPLDRQVAPSVFGRGRAALIFLFIITLFIGCQRAERRVGQTVVGAGIEIHNVYVDPAIDARIREVAVLPVSGMGSPEEAEQLRAVFIEELHRKRRYHILPEEGALAMADAVLQVHVISYHSYKPVSLGIRATLARADDGVVFWAVEEHFQSGDPAVRRSAMRFARDRYRQAYPAPSGEGILLSPTRFAHFAAATLFSTLPTREDIGSSPRL